jgi:hypothetical protein
MTYTLKLSLSISLLNNVYMVSVKYLRPLAIKQENKNYDIDGSELFRSLLVIIDSTQVPGKKKWQK